MNPAEYPHPSNEAVSKRMQRNRSSDTRMELRVRSLLHGAGLRFRKGLAIHVGDLRVRPDIVFTRVHIAVFLDGCFWHGCPEHGTQPRHNSNYWSAKLERNAARDSRVNEALARDGWTVLRFWEHERPEDVVAAVHKAVASPGFVV